MHVAFIVMLIILIGQTVVGFPVGVAMIVSAFVYVLLKHLGIGFVTSQIITGLYSNFLALAVPLFIFAAKVMNSGTVTDRMLRFIRALVGRFRGGMGHVNVVTNIFFAGMSGSGIADAAGVGVVLFRMMTKDGVYPPGFAASLSSAASTIGAIIPPSIIMILYALVSDQSVGALFLAGVVPGVLMGLCLMVLVYVVARVRGFPTDAPVAAGLMLRYFGGAILPLLTPVILLGGIYSGVFTPTEAAAVAAFYAIILTVVVYRDQGIGELYRIVLETARETAAVMLIYAGALAFNFVINIEQVPAHIGILLGGLHVSNQGFLLIVMAAFLLLGAFLDGNTLILVAFPLILPAIRAHGIDLVYFGVLASVNVQLGSITPPYGLVLFIMNSLTDTPLGDIIREIWPFILALVIALVLMVFVPDIVMWLPRQFHMG
jgi:tripartite ATP-independent transporter DctM subunit